MRTLKPILSMISGLLDMSLSPKTKIIYLWRPHDTSTNPGKSKIILEKYYLGEIQNYGFQQVLKRWAPTNPDESSHKSWKSRIWDQYLSKTRNGNLGNIGHCKLWSQETLNNENVQPLFLTSIYLCCVQHHRWKLLWATPSTLFGALRIRRDLLFCASL